ncbi:MAG: hypothetical protein KIT36_25115 [Alphaproteobacteria bacterium]|nr:hypothetical protein [Alphaproteobacteria bacterium]
MSPLKIAAIAGGIAAVVVVGGYFIYRTAVQQGGPAFEKSFNEGFLDSCLKSARAAAEKQGRSGPDVEALIQRRCSCALEVVKPLPVADKVALGTSESKQREVLAEVQKRCQ